jgi:magnesium chelatase family protein
MSLAHGGILFLDEMPEFPRDCLESLREPLETKQVRISRAKEQVEHPANFMLVAAMNPCPCGHWGGNVCRCSPDQVQRYRGRISGPLLDRFDLAVMLEQNTTPKQNNAATRAHGPGIESLANGSTSEMAHAVAGAREIARARQGCNNADLSIAKLNQMSLIESSAADLVSNMAQRMGWSLRVVHRLMRVARTIADLEDQQQVMPAQMAKAIGLRRGLDRPVTS